MSFYRHNILCCGSWKFVKYYVYFYFIFKQEMNKNVRKIKSFCFYFQQIYFLYLERNFILAPLFLIHFFDSNCVIF